MAYGGADLNVQVEYDLSHQLNNCTKGALRCLSGFETPTKPCRLEGAAGGGSWILASPRAFARDVIVLFGYVVPFWLALLPCQPLPTSPSSGRARPLRSEALGPLQIPGHHERCWQLQLREHTIPAPFATNEGGAG
eukprot:3490982-Pyramimonas_sp.AAC.1